MKLWSTVTLTDKCSFLVITNKPQVHITVTLQYTILLVEWMLPLEKRMKLWQHKMYLEEFKTT